MLSDYHERPWNISAKGKTFSEVYELWRKDTRLAPSTIRGLESKYRRYCKELYDIPYEQLRPRHFRNVIDGCESGYGTKNGIRALFRHLDKTAIEYEVIEKGYSELVQSYSVESSNRTPFTEDEIKRVWENKDAPDMDIVLIYLYTGFRRDELAQIKLSDIDLENWFMTGGLKTKAGRNRRVPIHKRIRPIVEKRAEAAEAAGLETLFGVTGPTLAAHFMAALDGLGMRHVVHECRHTLRTRLDNAGANKRCIDLIMGHSSQDVGERVYTHKTLEQLQEAMNLID